MSGHVSDFGRVARSLDLQRLRRDDQLSFALTEAELFQDLFEHLPEARVLGFYSASGVEYALERYGILERLRQRGFSDLVVSIDPSDPDLPDFAQLAALSDDKAYAALVESEAK